MVARVLLAGYGRVGRAFHNLVERRNDMTITAIARSTGPSVADLLDRDEFDVVADATPTDLSGGPSYHHARLALSRGIHYATAAKGALVRGYGELLQIADSTGAGIRFSAAAGAGLPTVDLAEFCLAGSRLVALEGILNGTSNYVLDQMRDGLTIEQALAEARTLGIAEGDGRKDVSGHDTAAKLIVLVNALMAASIDMNQISIEGVDAWERGRMASTWESGRYIRLIGRAGYRDGRIKAEVCLEEIGRDHPFAAVEGANKAITFETTNMGRITVTGGKSDPSAAGAALLRDVLLLLRVGPRLPRD